MKAVILAGGKGTRLQPYTTSFPKPLVPVGDKPILEILINQLASNGITDIIMTVGHLVELIRAYFGNGNKFGVNIKYSLIPRNSKTPYAWANIKWSIADSSLVYTVVEPELRQEEKELLRKIKAELIEKLDIDFTT